MSFITDIKRIGKEGFVSFRRNSLVSFAAIVVMTMSLLVMSGLLFLNAVLGFSLSQLQDRVDVNVYFTPDTPEQEILGLQTRIEDIPEVRDVTHVSRQEAFDQFQLRHQDDELIQRSLEELGDNPLGASLNIRAFNSVDYQTIMQNIETFSVVANTDYVERINYNDNQNLIERLNQFGAVARSIAYAVSMFFAAVAVLVIISTLRIAIFASRRDVVVKRLVGAEHRYVRGPFLIQGALYGIIGAVFTSLALMPVTRWVASRTETFFGGMNVAQYYQANMLQIFIIILAIGVILGLIASWISVRKYLKV